jgi:hypothetical protein
MSDIDSDEKSRGPAAVPIIIAAIVVVVVLVLSCVCCCLFGSVLSGFLTFITESSYGYY